MKNSYKVVLTIGGKYKQSITENSLDEVSKKQKMMMKRGYMGSFVTRVTKVFKNGKEIPSMKQKAVA